MRFGPLTVKKVYTLTLVGIFCLLTIAAVVSWGGNEITRIGGMYLEKISNHTNISNSVYGIYGMYRLYDTLFELLVFSTAVLGIAAFSDLESSEITSSETVESHVVDASASYLYPLIALFGLYLAYSAHLGPGGGFAGGVIAGSGVLLLAIAVGAEKIGQRFYEDLMNQVEYLILLLILTIVVLSVGLSLTFFRGTSGIAVIILVNLAIGTKVFIGTWTILHFFVKHRGEL